MISLKKLVRFARKWQNLAALRRKRISLPRLAESGNASIVDKGSFVVYTSDGIRFLIPLDYLKNDVFQEILEMAEEEYGSQSGGPIRLPLTATFMQYAIWEIEKQTSKDLKGKISMTNITSWKCLSNSHPCFEQVDQMQLLVC